MTAKRKQWLAWLLIGGPIAVFSLWALVDNTRLYLVTLLNGLTLASLYFIVASGFRLGFGLMRKVILSLGSLYLLGGYVGYVVAGYTGWWIVALAAGFLAAAIGGLLMQWLILRHMQGQDLRQTMVTIGLSIVIADILLWIFTGQVYQMEAPEWLQGPIRDIPLIRAYSAYRLSLLGFGIVIGLSGLMGLAGPYALFAAIIVLGEILVRRQSLALRAVGRGVRVVGARAETRLWGVVL